MDIGFYKKIQGWSDELDGVFTNRDLEIAYQDGSRSALYRMLEELISSGELIKVKRGIYATKAAELSTLSSRIYPESYVSTETVLAQQAIIGPVPARRIQAVKIGMPRIFKTAIGTIEFLSVHPKLFFGFERRRNCNWASPEKAFLDVCYFYYKRKKFSFDPITDINFELLDFQKIKEFLKLYDQRFITFFKKSWQINE